MGKTQDTKYFERIDGVKVFRYLQSWQGRGVLGCLLEYSWAMLWSFALLLWIWIKNGFDDFKYCIAEESWVVPLNGCERDWARWQRNVFGYPFIGGSLARSSWKPMKR